MPAQFLVVDFGAGRLAADAAQRLGHTYIEIDGQLADACGGDHEALRNQIAWPAPPGATLVIAFGDDCRALSSASDWEKELHQPLLRCFTVVRGLGPLVRDVGGQVIALLPATALFPDPLRGAICTLHRAALGFFEALRAEELRGGLRVSIAILDEREDARVFARRIDELARGRGLYSLPAAIGEHRLREYFTPMLGAAMNTPGAADFPLPPTPMGEVYAEEIAAGQTE